MGLKLGDKLSAITTPRALLMRGDPPFRREGPDKLAAIEAVEQKVLSGDSAKHLNDIAAGGEHRGNRDTKEPNRGSDRHARDRDRGREMYILHDDAERSAHARRDTQCCERGQAADGACDHTDQQTLRSRQSHERAGRKADRALGGRSVNTDSAGGER